MAGGLEEIFKTDKRYISIQPLFFGLVFRIFSFDGCIYFFIKPKFRDRNLKDKLFFKE